MALGDLPLCLRQDVMMEICGKILMTSALFEKVSASMLRPIVGHMTFVSIPAEQFIFQVAPALALPVPVPPLTICHRTATLATACTSS